MATIKIVGHRQRDAIHWVLSGPVPEEIDEAQDEWYVQGVTLGSDTLNVPTRLMGDLIEELEHCAVRVQDMADGLSCTDNDRKDAKATARALETIAKKLRAHG